jgi:hypothetical protein
MRDFLGFIYAISVVLAILFGVSVAIGRAMNGRGNFDLGGLCIVGLIFFGALAWLSLLLAG